MKSIWPLLLLLTACARPPGVHYRVEADVYVPDAKLLCKHAWEVARERFGLSVAEAVTMSRGEFDPLKCVAAMYQTQAPAEVVSAGIYVKRVATGGE